MNLTAENIVLVAKQHQIEELKRLASTAHFVEVICNLIHSLQAERGASSLYLASSGIRCKEIRQNIIKESRLLETRLRVLFTVQVDQATYANAKTLSFMAWVLLGLDDLGTLRQEVENFNLSATESITAYSRLIAGLISLIIDVADTAIDPRISKQLVALFNFVQGKELAGQERALGAYAFGSGVIDANHQQRILHLIDIQERHFEVFCEFTDKIFVAKWRELQLSPSCSKIKQLRRVVCQTKSKQLLDSNQSERWFESCSTRLTDMWVLQCALIQHINDYTSRLINEAELDLHDAKGLVRHIRDNPPPRADLCDRFFNPNIPLEQALEFMPPASIDSTQCKSIIDMLQLQSKKLADMETELSIVRKALAERKTIERAKGLLMARLNLSEEVAYKKLRSAAMEQNRRLADVAETILTLVNIE
ncbi:MAG: nitrate- and nitrite sensing domain-containing protein [Gammaproteobacteria bacterium]|jgi:hypothetical protein|uniref:nitrate- and nitrite sensing domain-containing protein n=1 Tax=Methylotuvimicrobium sp. TaxID=2822413 RepID=UPI001DF6DC3D|nr:nitrate- and nitrite sensing domain-containing protein [Gammaproteobacteria bacterium]